MESQQETGLPRESARQEAEIEFSRIVAFTDGVFAIAITLLVLTLEIPANLPDLGKGLSDQWPNLLAYGISFAVLGRFWMAHQRFFAALERFDTRLIGLNLLYLAFVALIPFTTKVLGDYGDQTGGVLIYTISMICVTAAFRICVVYALHHKLLAEGVYDSEEFVGWGGYLAIAVFVVSIPVAFLSPSNTP